MKLFPVHTQVPELSLVLAIVDKNYHSETVKFSFLLEFSKRLACVLKKNKEKKLIFP